MSTPELQPAAGKLILQENFDAPEHWTLGRSTKGSAAIANNELSLALSQPQGYLFSLRDQPALSDFYLEVTASPSICRGADEYGLLFRFNDPQNTFRFGVTCDGRARLDRLFKNAPSSPQPPIISGAIPPGAPSSSRLAISARGRQMEFFVNGASLFTVNDATLGKGSFGAYIRAGGEQSMTVNFSNLKIWAVADEVDLAASLTPTPPLIAGKPVLIYLVALDDNGKSGKPIGCGDSLVAVQATLMGQSDAAPSIEESIRSGLETLLAIKTIYYGQSGLYHSLYRADLSVTEVRLEGEKAIISLSGDFVIGGVCDGPRVQAQLEYTLRQFPGVGAVEIMINGLPLNDVLSGK